MQAVTFGEIQVDIRGRGICEVLFIISPIQIEYKREHHISLKLYFPCDIVCWVVYALLRATAAFKSGAQARPLVGCQACALTIKKIIRSFFYAV
jgi:hypothetical protein